METVVVLDSIDGFSMIECKMCLELKQVSRIFLLITKILKWGENFARYEFIANENISYGLVHGIKKVLADFY